MSSLPYKPPLALRSGHLQTIWPTLLRKPHLLTRERERIPTLDGDFLDLDWARRPYANRLTILTHGLEGHARSHYCQGMAHALYRAQWDVLAWNFRGCSGEPNRALQSYHSGATDDLETVLKHVKLNTHYDTICLVGFSLGGNLVLKYLGDRAQRIDPRIHAAVAISVPCHLESSARQLERPQNRLYMTRFLRSLRAKVREKAARFPQDLDLTGLDAIRTFAEFDGRYTAPIHGFRDAHDYWSQCSSRPVLSRISIPTLLINALDDPFLTPDCFPREVPAKNPRFFLETPAHGGHLGFVELNKEGLYWSERRALAFLNRAENLLL